MIRGVTALGLAVLLAGCGGGGDDRQAALQSLLDGWRHKSGAPGAVLGIRSGDAAAVIVASGASETGGAVAMRAADRFHAGSITKTFVAALVGKMAEEGRLSLDESLDHFLPDFPNAQAITLRHLLQHRSGLAEFESAPDFIAAVRADLAHRWTPEELIAFAARQPALAPPGMQFNYANTNYILLGQVVRKASGNAFEAELAARILQPLALASTLMAPASAIPGGIVHGYSRRYAPYLGQSLLDVSTIPNEALETISWTAGNVVSDAEDLLAWARSLYGGSLLRADSLMQMVATDPALGSYGLGTYRIATPLGDAVGHGGEWPGFQGEMWWLTGARTGVVILANTDDVDLGDLRAQVFQYLSQGSDAAPVQALVSKLGSSDAETRRQAAHDLGALRAGGRRAAAALGEVLMKDPVAAVRREAALSLGLIGDPQSIAPLIAGLKDSDASVRAACALALGLYGAAAKGAIPALQEATRDPDSGVRNAANLALSHIPM